MQPAKNVDEKTVQGFGDEWQSFDQSEENLDAKSRRDIFDSYFKIFPWNSLPLGAVGADFGCGSGRWTALVAPRVGKIHAVDASNAALAVARRNLSSLPNVEFHHSDLSTVPLPEGSLDFAFSLGVLHHLPDTQRAIADIATKLKPGAPFLVYLYYAMDNRPAWFRGLWVLTNYMRRVISTLPHALKLGITTVLAGLIYWPLARMASVLEKLGLHFSFLPLAFYRDKPFYVMRTDAYDRFCTRLEQRFSKDEINAMLLKAGFSNIVFSDTEPYWCAVGVRTR